jgi:hypothetical protein
LPAFFVPLIRVGFITALVMISGTLSKEGDESVGREWVEVDGGEGFRGHKLWLIYRLSQQYPPKP